jgi:glycerophosphoryl diester phosphodiesterase
MHRGRLLLGVTGALATAVTLSWALRPAPAPPPPALEGILIAHRAGLDEAPENSVQAIRAAAARGASAVELDVRPGPDGPVCAHDADQVAGAPLLAEALPVALQLGLLVELDVKGGALGGRALVHDVVALVAAQDAPGRVWVSAFHPLTQWHVRRADPALPLGIPLTRAPWTGWATWVGASVLEPELSVVSTARVERWQRQGWAVEAWTVHDPERVRALRRAGVAVVVDAVAPHVD